MTGKIFAVVIGIAALIILAISLPSIPDAVESFRTDTRTQEYTVVTGDTTIASVALRQPLWNADVSYVVNVGSNATTDSLVAANYTSSSKSLNLTGLAANTTRLLSVDYRTAGLNDNPAADTGITFLPGIFVGLVILVPLIILASVLFG